jgi:hypothetical protein
MRFLLPAALAVALMTDSAETLAQSAPAGQFFGLGQTSTSCGAFVSAAEYNNRARQPADPPASFNDPVVASLMSWVEGFVSGINYMGSADRLAGQGVAAEARYRWLENYCRGHPLDPMLDAALALRLALIAKGM